jgi:hypothetical protein
MTRTHSTRDEGKSAPHQEQAVASEPSHDAVAQRAYELFCERGCADGRDIDDWLQAEQELRDGAAG